MRSNTDYNGKLVRNMLHNAKRETRISHLFQIDALRNLGEKKKDYITSDQQCRHVYTTYIYIYICTGCLPRKYNVNYNISDRSSVYSRIFDFRFAKLVLHFSLNFFFFWNFIKIFQLCFIVEKIYFKMILFIWNLFIV